MLNKTALIVDDSRTASQMLRLMLEREEFQVDVLGSAEDAIGYLRDHRPGIIFMDHLMPGMDGFQAVKEIKNSSVTSAIPIVMYTAKSGDLYVGQAHALGAVDILPKPPTRETLRAVFRRIDERLEAANEPETEPQGEAPAAAQTAAPVSVTVNDAAFEGETPAPAQTERAAQAAPAPAFLREVATDADEAPSGQRVSWWLALAAALAAFALGMQVAKQQGGDNPYLQTLSWALSEGLGYPYEEAPFSGERVTRIRTLIEHLREAGFRGTVRLEGNVGQFCLVAAPDGWRVADAGLPIEACEMLGLSAQEARQQSGRQSAEFRDLVQNSPLLAGSGIRIEIEALGDRNPRRPYPPQDQVASAGDWNRIAAENNRITVTLLPRD